MEHKEKMEHTNIVRSSQKLRHQNIHVMLSSAKKTKSKKNKKEKKVTCELLLYFFVLTRDIHFYDET